MKKKKIIFEIIFIIIVTGLTIYYLSTSGVFEHITEIKDLSFWQILVILVFAFLYILFDSFIIYRSMKPIKKNSNYFEALGMYAYGNLGSGVTPWKSGHFPMIGYYLNKRKYNIEDTLSVMASNQLIYSVTLPFIYLVFMIYSLANNCRVDIGEVSFPLFIVSVIGIVTNTAYFIVLMFMLYNEKFQKWVLELEIKVKRIKDEEKKEEYRANKLLKMKVYKETADRMRHNILGNIPSIISYILFMLVIFGMPYIIYIVISRQSFSINDYMYAFLLCQAMSYVTNIVPVPGGMIAAEFSFITVFEVFMGSFVNLAVLLYRFFTYILILILDFIFFIVFEIVERTKSAKNN